MSEQKTEDRSQKTVVASGRRQKGTTVAAHGQPWVWLAGGTLTICLVMTVGLLGLVLLRGTTTFWPGPVVQMKTAAGAVHMGEITRTSSYHPRPELIEALPEEARGQAEKLLAAVDGESQRWLVRTGNYELTNEHFNWVSDFELAEKSEPEWALIFERLSWGRFYGLPAAFLLDGRAVSEEPAAIWQEFKRWHKPVRERWEKRRGLETEALGKVNHGLEKSRLTVKEARQAERKALHAFGADSPEHRKVAGELARREEAFSGVKATADTDYARIREEIDQLNRENDRYQLKLVTSDGKEKLLPLAEVVRAYPANQLGLMARTGIYFDRWCEFFGDDPREANSEGGVFPAIFGTLVMTLIMCICVVPFGVLSALYLKEYAKAGPLVSVIRIAINNLAGVPSIVYGVFGLGFFCYLVGGSIDQLFYSAKLPSPTFGTGGILWASLTLALLTLPVVIVATEEALAAVSSSMREGSYACGASKWQTIRRIVLPRAMPGIMTGMILAMARGAGEVAPLMLVGAVKLAPELPVDGFAPFVHLERSFMHLGFHIYDLGFQSQNSEAAIPMVFSTTLLLILLIFLLNVGAIWLRGRLRRKFMVSTV